MLDQQALDCAFVRIWGLDGTVVGAGFLIQSRYVLTCAHVVNQALGKDLQASEKPEEASIGLDFPIIRMASFTSIQQIESRVVVWYPVEENQDFQDIAVLEILASLPQKAKPILLKEHGSSVNLTVKGFPPGYNRAAIATRIIVVGPIGGGLIQLHSEAESEVSVQSGFSGAPVWDSDQQASVGMLALSDPGKQLAQMISANCLQCVFLPLILYESKRSETQFLTEVSQAYRYAIPASWDRKDIPHSVEEVISELANISYVEGEEPAIARFCAYLLASLQSSHSETLRELERWGQQEFSDFDFGRLIKVAEQSIDEERRQIQERTTGKIQSHILILVQPDQEKYHVMVWQVADLASYEKDECAGIELWRQTEQPIDRHAIAQQVCQWIQLDRAQLNHSIIEFFFPLDLMDEAVDSWEIEDEAGISIPIGTEYVVVMRCTDRVLSSYANRDAWVSHWENKATQSQRNASDVLVEGCLEPRSLFSKLNQSTQTIGFHLAQPPDKFGKGSIFAVMLRTAHPVAVWLRESVSGVNCEQALEAFLQSHPIDVLPTAVKQERSNALAENRDCHIGHHLSLLWENPHLLPPIVDEGAMLSNVSL